VTLPSKVEPSCILGFGIILRKSNRNGSPNDQFEENAKFLVSQKKMSKNAFFQYRKLLVIEPRDLYTTVRHQ